MEVFNTKDSPEHINELKTFFQEITGKRSKNYTDKVLHKAEVWYILKQDNQIVGFSGIQIPKPFKKNNIARVLYRTYLSPSHRGRGMNTPRTNWKLTQHMQLEYCRLTNTTPVMTRENNGNINAINNICRAANIMTPSFEWHVPKGYFWTCDEVPTSNQNCWQKMVCPVDTNLNGLETMTDETYQNFFLN